MVPRCTDVLNRLQLIVHQIGKREAQLGLLNNICNDKVLLNSKILSSLKPRVGNQFSYKDLEKRKVHILTDARHELIQKCAIVEARRDIDHLKLRFNKLIKDRKIQTDVQESIRLEQSKIKIEHEKKHQKKLNFHHNQMLDRKVLSSNTCVRNQKQKQHVDKSQLQKRLQNKAYKERVRIKKNEWIKTHVETIKLNKVKNFSDKDIPNIVYLYLDKGLGFVESKIGNIEDIKFDAKDFLQKLGWKIYFKNNKP